MEQFVRNLLKIATKAALTAKAVKAGLRKSADLEDEVAGVQIRKQHIVERDGVAQQIVDHHIGP